MRARTCGRGRVSTLRVCVCVCVCAQNWTGGDANGYALLPLDNGKPVRFDLATGWFFALSAIFHLYPVVFYFPKFHIFSERLYWGQIEAAFSPWRCVDALAPTHTHTHTHSLFLTMRARVVGAVGSSTLRRPVS